MKKIFLSFNSAVSGRMAWMVALGFLFFGFSQSMNAQSFATSVAGSVVEIQKEYGADLISKAQALEVVEDQIELIFKNTTSAGAVEAHNSVKLAFLMATGESLKNNAEITEALQNGYNAASKRVLDFAVEVNLMSIYEQVYAELIQ